jgi:putative membrane protein
MYGGHWWGMGFSWLTGVVFIVLIIWLIIRVVNQDAYHRNRSSTAMDILKERYAKGEISKEEFEEKRKLIEQ